MRTNQPTRDTHRSLLRSRGLIILMMIFGWIAFSNHCALAAYFDRPDVAESCCMSDGNASSTMVECCNSAHALKPDSSLVSPSFVASPLMLPLLCSLGEEAAVALPPLLLAEACDPPVYLQSFAEQVLARSLPSHAPPRT